MVSTKFMIKMGTLYILLIFKKGDGIEKDFYDNGQLYYEIKTTNGYFTDILKLYKKMGS